MGPYSDVFSNAIDVILKSHKDYDPIFLGKAETKTLLTTKYDCAIAQSDQWKKRLLAEFSTLSQPTQGFLCSVIVNICNLYQQSVALKEQREKDKLPDLDMDDFVELVGENDREYERFFALRLSILSVLSPPWKTSGDSPALPRPPQRLESKAEAPKTLEERICRLAALVQNITPRAGFVGRLPEINSLQLTLAENLVSKYEGLLFETTGAVLERAEAHENRQNRQVERVKAEAFEKSLQFIEAQQKQKAECIIS